MTGIALPPPGNVEGVGCGVGDGSPDSPGVGEAPPGGSDPVAVADGVACSLGLGVGPAGEADG